MFAPRNVNRQLEIAIWVRAAINATAMAQMAVSNGEMSSQRFLGVVQGIIEAASKEIMKIPSIPTTPSVN